MPHARLTVGCIQWLWHGVTLRLFVLLLNNGSCKHKLRQPKIFIYSCHKRFIRQQLARYHYFDSKMVFLTTGVIGLVLYVLGIVLILLVLGFLITTGYIQYVHWKFSHIPQPTCPRYMLFNILSYSHLFQTRDQITTLFTHSFYLGHLLDVIRAQQEDKNDELSIATLLQQW